MQVKEKDPMIIQAGEGKKMRVMGNDVTVKLTKQETNGEYYLFEVVTPPGVGVPPHVHQHEDEIIEVVEGELEVQLGDQVYQAKAGALIHFVRYAPHGFRNTSPNPCRTRWTVIPGQSFEQFFNELGALPEGQPDLEKVAAIFAKYDIELLPLPQSEGVGGI
jgi:quercetin dioxygenase-like cupin family protein